MDELVDPIVIALYGLSGCGKSFSMLTLAKAITKNGNIGILRTERGTQDACMFLGINPNVIPIPTYKGMALPNDYLTAMHQLIEVGCDTVCIDSLTPQWNWMLAEVDRIKAGDHRKVKMAWSVMTPVYNEFVRKKEFYRVQKDYYTYGHSLSPDYVCPPYQ